MIAITRSHAYSLDGLAQVHADLDAAHRLGLDVTLCTDSSDGDPFDPLRLYRLVLTKAEAGTDELSRAFLATAGLPACTADQGDNN